MNDHIEKTIHDYRARALSLPNEQYPQDVRDLLSELNRRLFEEDLRVSPLLRSRSASSRFMRWTGELPKAYVLKRRLELARILQDECSLNKSTAAIWVGFSSVSSYERSRRRYSDRKDGEKEVQKS